MIHALIIAVILLLATPAHSGEHEVHPHTGWGWGGPEGSTLTAAAISEHRATVASMRACERDFPSFSVPYGTYLDNMGIYRVCPYLY